MQGTRPTSSTCDRVVGATHNPTRCRETTYTAVSWDHPPSPAAYYYALLSRGASHSRFLRVAYSSASDRLAASASCSPSLSPTSLSIPTPPLDPPHTSTASLTPPDSSHQKSVVHLPPIPPCFTSRFRADAQPRSVNPMSHSLKRRQPQWPKPPHYHAALLRSPLSCRKGLFRAVLPPNKAVDFFRWDTLVSARASLSASCHERDWTRSADVDACASLHVVEFALGPYEAAAGFFGWHGLGLATARHVRREHDKGVDDGWCWSQGLGLGRDSRIRRTPDLQFEIDEATVEEGRARWVRIAEELVGPPGIALPSIVEGDRSGKASSLSDSTRKGIIVVQPPLSIASRPVDIRWGPDIGPGPSRPFRAASASDEKRKAPPLGLTVSATSSSTSCKQEHKTDSPSTWWYGPSPRNAPPPAPHFPSLRVLPSPSVQCGLPPPQFSPQLPGGRVAPAQGHGYLYGAEPLGTSSPMTRDPNLAKSLPPHTHVFATPVTPTFVHPNQSPRCPTKSGLAQDDFDKETDTDHGYESTTTTTDSDPPPHTPIGATTTSHCVAALQLHGDDQAEMREVDSDAEHAAASLTIRFTDPSTPVKLLGRFSISPSSSLSSDSPDSCRDGCESSKTAVVFPSLNGSFCQGPPNVSVSFSSPGMSAQATPAGTMTPVSSSSLSSFKRSLSRPGHGDEGDSEVKRKCTSLEASARSVSGDGPAFVPSHCLPLLTSPRPGLRKDSQGFGEPVMPISPSSSSSSLPLSPSEGKMEPRPVPGWIGDKMLRESSGSPESTSPLSTHSAKSRSLSPGPHGVTSTCSTRSSSSGSTSFSSPTTTPASVSVFGGSYPSSPSPPSGSSLMTPNPTTLLPAFLATATVKRKKASRTREIVDRLRSSSIDAGKGVGLDGFGWLASSSTDREQDGKLGKASSGPDQAAGNHAEESQQSPSQLSQSGAGLASWVGSDLGKDRQALSSKFSESGLSRSGENSNGATQAVKVGSETHSSHASSRIVTASSGITPFPIFSVPQTPVSTFTKSRQSSLGGTGGRESATVNSSNNADGSKKSATIAMPPNAYSPGPQLVPGASNSGTLPSARSSHHLHPSPSHPAVYPQPALGPPPPILAVPAYPHPMYVPFTQYRLAPPPHQGQGTWVAVYPGHPHVHPVPAQAHVAPITGVSGMRHVNW